MPIEMQRSGDVGILRLSGTFAGEDAAAQVFRQFEAALTAKGAGVVINLLDVTWSDSCFIGELVRCCKVAREEGRPMSIVLGEVPERDGFACGPSLKDIFPTFLTEEAAVAYVASEPGDGDAVGDGNPGPNDWPCP